MPKSKEGTVLIGTVHWGEENAQKVIEALKREGIKRGDTVFLEGYPTEMKIDKAAVEKKQKMKH
ncbi:MAG: hypothetical protein V1494_00435 [Candidatus Diapherotrites archaeon]